MESQVNKERNSLIDEMIVLMNLLYECSCLEENEEEVEYRWLGGTYNVNPLPKEIHELWKQKNMFDVFQELFNNKFGSKIKELGKGSKVTTIPIPMPEEQKEIVRGFIAECANNEKFEKFYMDLYEIQKIAQEDRVFGKEKGTAFKRFWLNFQYLTARERQHRIITRLKENGVGELTLKKISEELNPGNMKISRFGINVRDLTTNTANELWKVGFRTILRDNEPEKEEAVISKIEEEGEFDTTYHEDFVKEMLGI